MKDGTEQEKRNEGEHKKPIVALSAFTLMLLGAGGVGSSALASTSTASSQLAQANVAAPISKAELVSKNSAVLGVSPKKVHTFYNHHNNRSNHVNNVWTGNNLNTVVVENGPAFPFNATSASRRFDV